MRHKIVDFINIEVVFKSFKILLLAPYAVTAFNSTP